MPDTTFAVIGVYKPYIPDEVYQEQWQVTASDEETRAHFDGLVLIEFMLEDPTGAFKPEQVGQQYQGLNGVRVKWSAHR
jgi:hypothetical protein